MLIPRLHGRSAPGRLGLATVRYIANIHTWTVLCNTQIGEAGEDDPGFYLRSVDPAQSKLRAATLAREKNGCVLASLPHTRRADVARAPRSPHFSKYAQPTNRPISTRGAWTPPAARLQMLFHAALDDNFLFMVPKDCGSRRIVRPSLLIRVGSR